MDLGSFVIKCLKPGGDTLATYAFTATEGEEVDLLADGTPANLRAADGATAALMCSDPALELAQKIAAGDWAVVSRRDVFV